MRRKIPAKNLKLLEIFHSFIQHIIQNTPKLTQWFKLFHVGHTKFSLRTGDWPINSWRNTNWCTAALMTNAMKKSHAKWTYLAYLLNDQEMQKQQRPSVFSFNHWGKTARQLDDHIGKWQYPDNHRDIKRKGTTTPRVCTKKILRLKLNLVLILVPSCKHRAFPVHDGYLERSVNKDSVTTKVTWNFTRSSTYYITFHRDSTFT